MSPPESCARVVDPASPSDYGRSATGHMKSGVHLRSPSRAAIVGFGISLAMLALVVGMSFRQLGRLREASRDVERSGEIAAHVELLRSYLRDAESAERGFVITGEDTYLEPYNIAT